jgi:hypothetical protein
LTALAHVGALPLEELLPGAAIALGLGIPALRAMAKSILSQPAARPKTGWRAPRR